MKLTTGLISVAPKIIFWADMPRDMPENLRTELLKQDLLVVSCTARELRNYQPPGAEKALYFFNLDQPFSGFRNDENAGSAADIVGKSRELVEIINKKFPGHALVHSSGNNPALYKMFRENNIPFIEKDLSSWEGVHNLVISLAQKIFNGGGVQGERAFVRIDYYPAQKIKVELQKPDNPQERVIHGFLKNLSMNGAGIVVQNQAVAEKFSLRETIKIQAFFSNTAALKITKAYITRIDTKNNEIGINFDPGNPGMVTREFADMLLSIILKWLYSILKNVGKFSHLEKTVIKS